MTGIERRQSPRVSPVGLKAIIKLETGDTPVILQAEVVDISYDGIKIKLQPRDASNLEGKIGIEVFLPDSIMPLSFSGVLKHFNQSGELGLRYVDCPVVESLDNFMFQCNKLAKS